MLTTMDLRRNKQRKDKHTKCQPVESTNSQLDLHCCRLPILDERIVGTERKGMANADTVARIARQNNADQRWRASDNNLLLLSRYSQSVGRSIGQSMFYRLAELVPAN